MKKFRRADWADDAACRGMDPNSFHPPKGGGGRMVRQAKAVCSDCPVKQPCLDYAIANVELRGIWGGLTEYERRSIRQPRFRLTSVS